MAHLHDTGEEFMQDLVTSSGETFQVGLYHDGKLSGDTSNGDDLADGDDLAAISTEPSTSNSYARQSVSASNVTVDVSGADAALDFPTVMFDVSTNSENPIDYYFVLANFDSDEAGDGGTASDHLYFTGELSQSRDLSQIETLEVDNIGGTQD